MTTIIDQDNVFRKFDYSSLITKEDNEQAMNEIREIINSGKYFKNNPKFQTEENLFQRQSPLWLKYRMSFLMSVFLYLGREVRVSDMMAWSFMTNLDGQEPRDNLWHTHSWDLKEGSILKKMSGIMYLHIPEDVADRDTCGTEMAPNGVSGDGKLFVRPSDYTWLIYPSQTWHRPGIVQSRNYRFILAADVKYQG